MAARVGAGVAPPVKIKMLCKTLEEYVALQQRDGNPMEIYYHADSLAEEFMEHFNKSEDKKALVHTELFRCWNLTPAALLCFVGGDKDLEQIAPYMDAKDWVEPYPGNESLLNFIIRGAAQCQDEAGHAACAKRVLRENPELRFRQNSDGFTPLRLLEHSRASNLESLKHAFSESAITTSAVEKLFESMQKTLFEKIASLEGRIEAIQAANGRVD